MSIKESLLLDVRNLKFRVKSLSVYIASLEEFLEDHGFAETVDGVPVHEKVVHMARASVISSSVVHTNCQKLEVHARRIQKDLNPSGKYEQQSFPFP